MYSKLMRREKVKNLKKIIMILSMVGYSTTCLAEEVSSERIINQLKSHYQISDKLNKFSITYKTSETFGSQSYDFNHPEKSYFRTNIEIDTTKKEYFLHTTSGKFPGGFVFETKEIQKNMERYEYDVNGVLYGKRIIERNTKYGFKRKLQEISNIVDVLAINPLLSSLFDVSSIKTKVDKKSNTLVLEQSTIDHGKISYTFQLKPIQLMSIYKENNDQMYTYRESVYSNGINYASQVLLREGNTETEYSIERLSKIINIESMKLSAPEGYAPIVKRGKKSLTTEMIATNLYIINNVYGDRNVLYKVSDNGIVLFGAPGSDKESEKVAALINKQFPMKNITHVYVTHPHGDHIGGLTSYVKSGVIILADAYSVEAIKAFPEFSKDIAFFNFHTITHKELFNGVRFYIPPNSHAKGQSFAYFEKPQIIYEGDFLEIPFDNTIATYMSKVEQMFVEYIRMENLQISRIVGHHRNGNISPKTMNQYYQVNVTKKR